MKNNELVEKVAEHTFYSQYLGTGVTWDAAIPETREKYRTQATAILALIEPPELSRKVSEMKTNCNHTSAALCPTCRQANIDEMNLESNSFDNFVAYDNSDLTAKLLASEARVTNLEGIVQRFIDGVEAHADNDLKKRLSVHLLCMKNALKEQA